MHSVIQSKTWEMAKILLRANPKRVAVTLLCLLMAGLVEGFGIVTLLPILELTTGQKPDSELSKLLNQFFAQFGLVPNLGPLLIMMVFGISAKAALTWLAQRVVSFGAADFAHEQRVQLMSGLMRAGWPFFVTLSIGRVSNALSNEANAAAGVYNSLTNFLATLIQVLVFSALAFVSSWQVTAAGILTGVLSFGLLRRLVSVARKAGGEQASQMNVLLRRLADGIQLIKPLKAMGQEERLLPLLEKEAKAANQAQRRVAVATSTLGIMQEPVMVVVLASGLFVMLSYFHYSLSDLLFMAILFQRIAVRTGGLQVQYQKMIAQEAAFWSLRQLVDLSKLSAEIDLEGTPVQPLVREIRFDQVRFSHNDQILFSELSLDIPARGITALIGPSGAGKTTILDLLIGLLTPTSGRIMVDDIDLGQLDRRQWRSKIGYVPQDHVLLNDSIANNVTFGATSINEDQIIEALKAAGAWAFVENIEGRLNGMVGERGAALSGGQRQRIALARALIRKPQILILDEPTTALDKETEAAIVATLQTLSAKMAIILVSHQTALVQAADRIYVVENGMAIEKTKSPISSQSF